MAIYITWQESEYKFKEWHYAGNGITEPVLEEIIVTKKVLYSNDTSDKMKTKAKKYVETDMQDRPSAKVVVV